VPDFGDGSRTAHFPECAAADLNDRCFYNFARPHMSLREKVDETDKPFQQKWKPKTPAMATGFTSRKAGWTFRELSTVKL
jgi:hypothetical protein